MFKKCLPLVLLLAFVSFEGLWAASSPPVISVVKKGAKKNAVSFANLSAPGPGGQLFVKTLQKNLKLSGWFDLSGAGKGGSVTVKGRVADAGGGIQSSLRVSWPGKAFNWAKVSTGKQEIRRQAHKLADEMVRLIAGEKGIASTRIVFVNRRASNNADIYMCDADGGSLMQLTKDNVAAVGPRWAPNGRDIFYTSFLKGYPSILRLINCGRSRKTLASFKGLNTGAAVSPDGSKIALILSYQGNPELYILSVANGHLTRMTKSSHGVEASPCWSPDGRSIVYVSDVSKNPHLYIVNVASRKAHRLTYRGAQNVNPDWSSKGKIVYASKGSRGWQIATLDPQKGEGSTTFVTTTGGYEHPSWAADSRHIVCCRSSVLYILDTLGDPAVRLTRISGNWMSPDWSDR
ncbi:MAG: DPP IV N-terminal domain-containing protein [Kiritimatiellae bacterium]|jgi:TolB protein|nr:DPP IV N-terminal domain-containing protein [Kiritimatiellia bacterium]